MESIRQQGYNDTLNFLRKEGNEVKGLGTNVD